MAKSLYCVGILPFFKGSYSERSLIQFKIYGESYKGNPIECSNFCLVHMQYGLLYAYSSDVLFFLAITELLPGILNQLVSTLICG